MANDHGAHSDYRLLFKLLQSTFQKLAIFATTRSIKRGRQFNKNQLSDNGNLTKFSTNEILLLACCHYLIYKGILFVNSSQYPPKSSQSIKTYCSYVITFLFIKALQLFIPQHFVQNRFDQSFFFSRMRFLMHLKRHYLSHHSGLKRSRQLYVKTLTCPCKNTIQATMNLFSVKPFLVYQN